VNVNIGTDLLARIVSHTNRKFSVAIIGGARVEKARNTG
jgi:hypothetical protein